MKKLTALALMFVAAIGLRANSYTFTAPTFLHSLTHSYAYTWGIYNSLYGASEPNLRWDLTHGYTITAVTFKIWGIYNWDSTDTENQLFIHLLDNPRRGVRTAIDDSADNGSNQGTISDFFDVNSGGTNYGSSSSAFLNNGDSTNVYLTQYNDGDGPTTHVDLTYDFSGLGSTFVTYIKNGHTGDNAGAGIYYADFGLGFDPDCHYYDCMMKLYITTAQVPDSGTTMIMLGAGLLALCGVGLVLQRRSRKA